MAQQVDTSGLRKKFAQLPDAIETALTKQLEKEAARLVGSMKAIMPDIPGLDVKWTWGSAPRGSITVGTYGRTTTNEMKVTIYATFRSGYAGWWEFGTAPRFQKKTGRYTGQITAQPFFYPAYRANKQQIMNRLRAALRRAVRRMNA